MICMRYYTLVPLVDELYALQDTPKRDVHNFQRSERHFAQGDIHTKISTSLSDEVGGKCIKRSFRVTFRKQESKLIRFSRVRLLQTVLDAKIKTATRNEEVTETAE